MNSETVRREVEKRVSSGFSTLTVKYPNVKFIEPQDTGFVALDFLGHSEEQGSVGTFSPLFNSVITFQLSTFMPRGTGMKAIYDVNDELNILFRGWNVSPSEGGRISTVRTETTGIGFESDWMNVVLSVTLRAEQNHSVS